MQLIDKSTLVEYIQDLIEKQQNQKYEFFEAAERKMLLQTLLDIVNEMKVYEIKLIIKIDDE